jgi:Fibronectin type III domain
MPPVGLKATVLSATTIVLTWIDSTLGRSQRVTDNRLYTVRYQPRGGSGSGPALSRKPKLVNTTNLNIHIEELKPDTEYEFSVKVVKARRQSAWSLSVFNKTKEMGTCLTLSFLDNPIQCLTAIYALLKLPFFFNGVNNCAYSRSTIWPSCVDTPLTEYSS